MSSCTCLEASSCQLPQDSPAVRPPSLHVREQLALDKVSYAYNVLYDAFKPLSRGYSPAERAALFHDTAARVYRLAV